MNPYTGHNVAEATGEMIFFDQMTPERKAIAERLIKSMKQYHNNGTGAENVAAALEALVYGYWQPKIEAEQERVHAWNGWNHE